jgi:hypothetical protein
MTTLDDNPRAVQISRSADRPLTTLWWPARRPVAQVANRRCAAKRRSEARFHVRRGVTSVGAVVGCVPTAIAVDAPATAGRWLVWSNDTSTLGDLTSTRDEHVESEVGRLLLGGVGVVPVARAGCQDKCPIADGAVAAKTKRDPLGRGSRSLPAGVSLRRVRRRGLLAGPGDGGRPGRGSDPTPRIPPWPAGQRSRPRRS